MFVDMVFYLLLWHLEALQTFTSYELSQIKFRTFPNKILRFKSTHCDFRTAAVPKGAVGRAEGSAGVWGGPVAPGTGPTHHCTPGGVLRSCKPARTAHLISGICAPVVKHSHH